jgi:hypothetical protein
MKLDQFAGTGSAVEEDRLPGSNRIVESGVYPMKIDLAYIDTSAATGAVALKVHFKDVSGGFTLREAFWIRSGKAKGHKTTYIGSDGQERDLPGLLQANALCVATMGKPLSQLEAEEKVVPMWSFETSKEENTKLLVVLPLIGKHVQIGVLKKVRNKRAKGGDGTWGPTGERQEINELDKIFNVDGLTAAEKKSGAVKPEFKEKWEAKFGGQVIDEFDASIKPAEPVPTNTAPPTESLFDD